MNEIILDYFGSDYNPKKGKDELITCKFKIKYPSENKEFKEAVQECITWMGTVGSPIFIMNNTDTEFELKITGRGHDNRCALCRQFRTGLRKILIKKKLNLRQKRFCRFDEDEGYGIDRLERLKQIEKMKELGLMEE